MTERELELAAAIGRRLRFVTDPREDYVQTMRCADPTGITRRLVVREEVVEWKMTCDCYLIATLGNVQLWPCWKHGGS